MPARKKQPREKEHPIGQERYLVAYLTSEGITGVWDTTLTTVDDGKDALREAAVGDSDTYFLCELVPRFRAKRPADITIEPV